MVAILGAFVLLLAPQGGEAPAPGVACRVCANHGALPCSKHGRNALLLEQEVQFCSVAADCKACGGVLRVDCKQCRNAAVEAELQQRLERVQAWRANLRTTVDEVAHGLPLAHVQTAHVDLSYGIRPLTVGRDKLDTHEGMHLYARRLEDLRAQFLALLEATDQDLSARLQIYMCRDEQAHDNLAPRVTGLGGASSAGVKLMGVQAVYCMWQDLRSMPDDESLYRNIVHNVSHLLLSNLAPAQRIGNPGNGWVDEGLAHWFEDKVTGKCANFCFEEVALQPGAGFKSGRWRTPVRHMADEGKLASCADLTAKNSDQLEFPEHAQAFAMVDFLLASRGGARFRDFARKLKERTALRDAMQQVYGCNPLQFDTEFQAWVKANYSPQESSR